MYLNQVVLVGEIVSEPKLRPPKDKDAKTTLLDFRLRVLRRHWRKERMSIRVVVFGGGAGAFARYKRKGDYVIVSGRLCQATFEGKEGGHIEHHYVVAEQFRFLWGPPGKFVRGHVLVPRHFYDRWTAFEEEVGPVCIPKKTRDRIPADVRRLAGDDGSDVPLDAETQKWWLEELHRESLQMPNAGAATGYDPDIERTSS